MCRAPGGPLGLTSEEKIDLLAGLDRREFMSFCALMAATLGLSAAYIPKIAEAVEAGARRQPVIWLHFAECTADT